MIEPQIFADVIKSYLPEPHASLLNGIIFGIAVKQSKEFYTQLKIVGLVHIVVLSGSNISLLAAIITSCTLFLGRYISAIISIISIIAFVLFVGPQPPIVRAGCMGVLTLIALLYGRKTITLWSLFLSFIFIAIFWPEWLTGLSLKLSYAATLGLILFAKQPEVQQKKDIPSLQKYIQNELRTSLAAQAFTVPMIFWYFKEISFISPVSNVLISWAIAPLMIFGFLTALLGKIHFVLGLLPSYVCYTLLSYIIWIVEVLSKVPYAAVKF